jgi:hypothetical protein
VHAPSEEKSDDSKDNVYEELDRVLDHFPKYHTKILLGDFDEKLGREDIFKPTIRNESLHQDSNDNGFRIANLATSKNWLLKARCSRTEIFISTLGSIRMGRLITTLITY